MSSTPHGKLRVAILGSGNIGTDLLMKTLRSPSLQCKLFIGRNPESNGMRKARALGVDVSDKSIQAIIDRPDVCDVVFDATSAKDHQAHWPILEKLGKFVIDMTPARMGRMCVPALDGDSPWDGPMVANINMISCGGQATIPLAEALRSVHQDIGYIEVVSSISSKSAGPATRSNLDQYIETTEEALRQFSGCREAKAILNLNPAEPPIDMQTTLFAKVENPNIEALRPAIAGAVARIQRYVPGYELVIPPSVQDGRITVMVKVRGRGDYLPTYAGNLDIVNCAAISVAERFAAAYTFLPRAHAVGLHQ